MEQTRATVTDSQRERSKIKNYTGTLEMRVKLHPISCITYTGRIFQINWKVEDRDILESREIH